MPASNSLMMSVSVVQMWPRLGLTKRRIEGSMHGHLVARSWPSVPSIASSVSMSRAGSMSMHSEVLKLREAAEALLTVRNGGAAYAYAASGLPVASQRSSGRTPVMAGSARTLAR